MIHGTRQGLHTDGKLRVEVKCLEKGQNQKAMGAGTATAAVAALLESEVRDNGDGTYSVEYTSVAPGVHEIGVLYKKQHIRGSPFKPVHKMSPDASKCRVRPSWLKDTESPTSADGKQQKPAGIRAKLGRKNAEPQTDNAAVVTEGDSAQLSVDASNAGEGELTATALCNDEPIDVLIDSMKDKKGRVYLPNVPKPGEYRVDVEWSGQPMAKSPFFFTVVERLSASDMTVSILVKSVVGRGFAFSSILFRSTFRSLSAYFLLLIQSTLRITTFGGASEKCPYSRSVLIREVPFKCM